MTRNGRVGHSTSYETVSRVLPPTRDLHEVDVFFESWKSDKESMFDANVDRRAREDVLRSRVCRGICNVSGRPDDFVAFGENFREDFIASGSGSSARMRALAAVMSWSQFGHPLCSIALTCDALSSRTARTYFAGAGGVLYHALRARLGDTLIRADAPHGIADSNRLASSYGRLQALPFDNASMDLVVASDVLEHVPDAVAAETEVVRVLRPGGWYLFTVPFDVTLPHDRVRASLQADGTITFHEPPEYHAGGRGLADDLVYRDFSESDLRARFHALHCSFDVVRVWSRGLGILGTDMMVMAVRRLR